MVEPVATVAPTAPIALKTVSTASGMEDPEGRTYAIIRKPGSPSRKKAIAARI
jgi:hypothetical protein